MGGRSNYGARSALRRIDEGLDDVRSVGDKWDKNDYKDYVLKRMSVQGNLEDADYKDSELGKISLDSRLDNAQYEQLASLDELSKTGMNEADKGVREEILMNAAEKEIAGRKAIDQEEMLKGTFDSGLSSVSKRDNLAKSFRNARDDSRDLIRDVLNRKLQAGAQRSQLAGNMQDADFRRKAMMGSAQDRINQAAAENRWDTKRLNLANLQRVADSNVGLTNTQQQLNNQLIGQRRSDNLSLLNARNQLRGGAANIAGSQTPGTSFMQGLGTVGGAIIGGYYGGPKGAQVGAQAGASMGTALSEDGGVIHAENGFPDRKGRYVLDNEAPGGSVFVPYASKEEEDAAYGQGVVDSGQITEEELIQKRNEEDGSMLGSIAEGLKALNSGSSPERRMSPIEIRGVQRENVLNPIPTQSFNNPFMARDGGLYDGTSYAANGEVLFDSQGQGAVVGGDSYERDRVDARINSGEMILNAAQQQRLMDVLRGEEDLDSLGDEDIVEGVPKEYQEELKEGKDPKVAGLEKLLEALGRA